MMNGQTPTSAANWISTRGTTFRDRDGRHVILRGVNFGGDCKVPTIGGHSYLPSDFADHRKVSFVGRPAPLEELDSHLARLAHWGFNGLRLLTTWEAVEHAGPGMYDEAYLDYIAEVCRRAGQYGLSLFIDFHQDVWSRMSGGDGAPGWTFEVAGLDFTKFHETSAALVMQHAYDHRLGGQQDSYPLMNWSGNYARPANAIMWTLFFAGKDFAPTCLVDGRNIQDVLQDSYFGAMRAVAERVADIDNVIGFDTLNEPGSGLIGKPMSQPIRRGQGTVFSPLNALAVASGATRELDIMRFGDGIIGQQRVNPDGVSIWLPGRDDPFRSAGAWDFDASGNPIALQEDYFEIRDGHVVDHETDYMLPFFHRIAETVRAVRDDWLVFAEVDPFDAAKGHCFPENVPPRTVNASHWYDFTALAQKRFSLDGMKHVLTGTLRSGRAEIEDGYVREMAVLRRIGEALNGGAPTLIGECGIQFDMNDAEAYRRWAEGDRDPAIWAAQTAALDLMYNALDQLLLSSTQWNYTVSNRNDPMIGDGWNQEDLSIWSVDQVTDANDPDSGGRGILGFCRPYVRAAQGTLVSHSFDSVTGQFDAVVDVDTNVDAPSEIYVPTIQYPNGYEVACNNATVHDDGQLLFIRATNAGPFSIQLTRR